MKIKVPGLVTFGVYYVLTYLTYVIYLDGWRVSSKPAELCREVFQINVQIVIFQNSFYTFAVKAVDIAIDDIGRYWYGTLHLTL